MNIGTETGWLKPKIEGVGQVIQADEKIVPDSDPETLPTAQGITTNPVSGEEE